MDIILSFLAIVVLIPFFLIAIEPDLGSALVMLLVGYGILFVVGVNWKIWLTIFIFLAALFPPFYTYGLKDYQKKRVHDFIVAEKPSYHVQQSIIAIGSGGLTGKDSDEATQTQLRFLPIATSDFIFAYFIFILKSTIVKISFKSFSSVTSKIKGNNFPITLVFLKLSFISLLMGSESISFLYFSVK